MRNTAVMVQGLGFGDEGKGTMVDFICRERDARLVVRFNGGAQAAHNVVTPEGKHHTFSQWGAGTLAGVNTLLGPEVMFDPLAMAAEARRLSALGVDPYRMMHVDLNAPIITPYHRAVNRIKETFRGDGLHGSTGIGIGECMHDLLLFGRQTVPIARDLLNQHVLAAKLNDIKLFAKNKVNSWMLKQAHAADKALLESPVEEWLKRYSNTPAIKLVSSEAMIFEALSDGTVVFEGAQGVLLHQDYGFHPHTTWSDTTFKNADVLLRSVGGRAKVEKIGVIRSYMTRHGAGPMPTESAELQPHNSHDHNQPAPFTGSMRVGYLDLPLLRYSLEVIGSLDGLAVTHTDKPLNAVCTGYVREENNRFFRKDGSIYVQLPPPDMQSEDSFLGYQQEIGEMLKKITPKYEALSVYDAVDLLGQKILYTSSGPTWKDKNVHY